MLGYLGSVFTAETEFREFNWQAAVAVGNWRLSLIGATKIRNLKIFGPNLNQFEQWRFRRKIGKPRAWK